MIEIPVEIGDTIYVGRFKNKAIVVKEIGKDEHGMPTINGRKILTFKMKPKSNLNYEGKQLVKKILDESKTW